MVRVWGLGFGVWGSVWSRGERSGGPHGSFRDEVLGLMALAWAVRGFGVV